MNQHTANSSLPDDLDLLQTHKMVGTRAGAHKDLAGIYAITCQVDQKVYVGSSVRLRKRKNTHVHLLVGGRHGNVKLQNAVNKYGIDQFRYEVLEYLNVNNFEEIRATREQHWMDMLAAHSQGYNLAPFAVPGKTGLPCPPEIRQKISEGNSKRFKLTSPDGEIFEVVNLLEFAKARGLRAGGFYQAANINRSQRYKGWVVEPQDVSGQEGIEYSNRQEQPIYRFISQSGIVILGSSVEAFANERGIHPGGLRRTLQSERTKWMKGWRVEMNGEPSKFSETIFILSDGSTEFRVRSLAQFSRENSLTVSGLSLLTSGKLQTYRGFRGRREVIGGPPTP